MNRQKEYSNYGRYTEIRKVTEEGGGGSATAIKIFKCSVFSILPKMPLRFSLHTSSMRSPVVRLM